MSDETEEALNFWDEKDDSGNKSLVAYRLGKVEKGLELSHRMSVQRDDKILAKLDEVSKLGEKVAQNTWRIGNLEKSRDRLVAATSVTATGLAIALITRVLDIL